MKNKIIIISLFVAITLISLGILLPKTLRNSYAVSTTFADTIMSLATTSACNAGGTGVCATNSYTDSGTAKYHDYRYRGAEPNNYVLFNNELYRIIGVFDENSHGVKGEYLVKLIIANQVFSFSWGAYNTTNTSGTYRNSKNDWTGNTTGVKANTNVILNEYFYNKTNTSSTYGTCSDWTYFSGSEKTFNCLNIIVHGMDSDFRNYIEEVTWYLNGYNSREYSKQNFYLCERGLSTDITNCMSANSGAYDASTTSKIGLMYVSDYLYASSYYEDTATDNASSSYYGNKNWLYKGYEWTLTPQSDNDTNIFIVYSAGNIYTHRVYDGNSIRPSFYLKSNVNVTGGSGTFDDPYTLSM